MTLLGSFFMSIAFVLACTIYIFLISSLAAYLVGTGTIWAVLGWGIPAFLILVLGFYWVTN